MGKRAPDVRPVQVFRHRPVVQVRVVGDLAEEFTAHLQPFDEFVNDAKARVFSAMMKSDSDVQQSFAVAKRDLAMKCDCDSCWSMVWLLDESLHHDFGATGKWRPGPLTRERCDHAQLS
jgi:hypothetical protein